jgi:hypothetical protein
VNGLSRAVLDLGGFLESNRVPYMVIGGFANLFWGNPRLTQDIDVTVRVADAAWPDFVSKLTARYRSTVTGPLEFVRRTRVLPIVCGEEMNADLIFAALPFEDEAIARAVANLGPRVAELAKGLERPEMAERFAEALRRTDKLKT